MYVGRIVLYDLGNFLFFQAIVHEETTKRRQVFNLWLERAHSRLIDNEQNVRIERRFISLETFVGIFFAKIVAERHYLRTIIGRAWLSWRQLIDERQNEERAERIAVQFYYHTIERRVLNAWKLVRLSFSPISNRTISIIVVSSSLSLYERNVSSE